MSYTRRDQNIITIAIIIMLCYAISSLVWLRLNAWETTGLLLFCINIVNILLAFFERTNKILTACVNIFVGFLTMFLLKGVIFWFAAVLGFFGIFLFIYLLLNDN